MDYIIDGLNNVRKELPLKTAIHQTNLNMIAQFCCMYDAVFSTLSTNETATLETKITSTTTITNDGAIIECRFIDVKTQKIL